MRKIGNRVRALRAYVSALLAGSAGSMVAAQTTQDDVDWALARADGTISAYERYLERHPLGKFASEAFYQLTIQSIDPNAARGIEPGAGPETPGGSGVVGTALDVY